MSFFKNVFGMDDKNQSVSKVGWSQLTDLRQLNEITDISTEKPVAIFKHSTRCHISKMVLRQFENEFDSQKQITPYFLDLLEHREISNEIAARFGIMHQSPQLIVIKDGKAVYDASHESIDAEKLKQFI